MDNEAKIVLSAEDRSARVLALAKSNLAGVETQVNSLQSAFRAIGGALVVRELSRIAGSAIDAAGDLSVLSEKTDLTVADLSALKFAARQANADFAVFAKGLKTLSVNAREAARGSAEQRDAFDDVGVSAVDANGKLRGLNALLPEIADTFANMPNGVEKTALAVKLFGKAGEELIPFLNGGSKGMAEMRREAERLGLIIDDKLANDARTAGDSIDRLKSVAEAAAIKIGGGMTPAISDLALALSDAVKSGDGLVGIGESIGNFMRFVASTADGASTAVELFGNSLGAVLAIQERLLRGDFKGAAAIFSFASEDTDKILQQGANQIAAIKGVAQAANQQAAQSNDERLTQERRFGSLLRDVKKGELDSIKTILAAQVAAYKDAENELEKVRAKRIAAEEQAAQFMAKITAATRPAGAQATNLEVAQNIAQARELIAAGGKDDLGIQRTDQALEQLKQARELLLQMKAAGVSRDFLTAQAREIATLEKSAIAAQEADSQARKDAITKAFDELLAKAKALTKIKIDFDTAAIETDAEKVRALLQEKLAATPIVVPVVPVPSDTGDIGKLLSRGSDTPGSYGSDAQGRYYVLDNIPQRASGGPISGPGGPRDDKVLVWGSNGEFVQPAAAVGYYGRDFMEALRTLKIPRLAAGGPVLPALPRATSTAQVGDTVNIHLNGYGPFQMTAAPDVSAALQRVLSREALKRGART